MKLSQFQFNLPADKIATEPPRWRDECKLMVLHKNTGEIEHRLFKDIIEYFGKGDTFVLNDTKVFPARLYGNKEKTGADISRVCICFCFTQVVWIRNAVMILCALCAWKSVFLRIVYAVKTIRKISTKRC